MSRWIVLAALLGSTAAGAEPGGGTEVMVGVARVDVTPDGPVRLSGYLARAGESAGVAQRIWAKALAVGSDDQGPAVLVAVDNVGVGADTVEEVAGRLKRKANLPRDRFTVASSHTHSAPCLTNVLPNIFGRKLDAGEQARVDAYTRELADRIERVCLDALAARRPGRLAWSQGSVGFAANRRTKGGPVDHSMPVLRVTDPGGALRAVLVNYACHCTTLDPAENTVSGDWAGFAQAAIEADHPGAVALTVVGCGADLNPSPRVVKGAAEAHGRAVAAEVKRLLAGRWTDLPGPPRTAMERFTLPLDTPPTRERLDALVKAGGAPGYNAAKQIARLDRGEPLQSRVDYSAQSWAFGDKLVMVFLPGEVVVDFVLRIKREFDPARVWVTAYANDVPCYIPSERVLREGGYEAGGAMTYYDRPARLRPGLEQRILDAVHTVVPASFRAKGQADDDDNDAPPPPRSPAESLKSFRTKPGLRLELVAAEPLVESPVAVDFGGDGRLWVCEMRDYPTGIDGRWTPGGAVKVLEDRDGDGRYETATTFLDGLPFPTGVMAWRKGVLVCAAPEILYAEDTDGDGKADVRKVLFRGFATENFQARVNALSYARDNWVYGANGLIGGTIRGTATGRAVNIGGRDFRIRPDTGVMEPASGLTQQGRVHDDWGNQFGGNNSVLIQHYPLPDHYSSRNPRVAAPAPAVYLPRDPESTRVYPASRTLARYNHPESADRVTSACSPLVYRDDLLGPGYAGNAFVCEPVHNLVTRQVVVPSGVTFASHRADDEQTSEFLASTDPWSRPVQVRTGPDGALWVVDMYRFVIEHPRWISPDRLAGLDVRAGADRGRIYRLVPDGVPPRPVPRFEGLDTAALVAALDTPNGTARDTVQRLLVHRADPAAVPLLTELARTSPRAECRAQALGALDGLGGLDPEALSLALKDPHPGVRREAVRLAEPWLAKGEPRLTAAVAALAGDPALVVRYQVALSLGESPAAEAGRALGAVATRDGGDPWVRAAVLSASAAHASAVFEAVASAAGPAGPPPALVEPLIATLAAGRDPGKVARVLAVIGGAGQGGPGAPWRAGAAAQLLDAVGDPGVASDPSLAPVFAAARATAADPSAGPGARAAAVRLLGKAAPFGDRDRDLIAARIAPAEPAEVQRAAVLVLARRDDAGGTLAVVSALPRLGPAVRAAALDALLANPAGRDALVAALEAGRLAPGSVDATHRQQLLGSGTGAQRRRAADAFRAFAIGARADVLARYAAAKTLAGDPARGKAAFARVCAACHKFGGQGHEVGPDLAALTDTSPDALLTAVLDPNREVDARYAGYTAALKDGRVVTGLIASETASAVTLKRQEGQADVVLRADLDEVATSGKSLMPEGLENDLTPADLADLLAYLALGADRPKVVAGNRPVTVAADARGVVTLAASAAEIFGPSLTFEPGHGNLGFWNSPDDRAAWTFTVARGGTYTVSMDWACADESAGNRFTVRVGKSTIASGVGGTGAGTWQNYRSIFLGELTLAPGTHRLDLRPAGPLRSALADLRSLTLTPRASSVFPAKTP